MKYFILTGKTQECLFFVQYVVLTITCKNFPNTQTFITIFSILNIFQILFICIFSEYAVHVYRPKVFFFNLFVFFYYIKNIIK